MKIEVQSSLWLVVAAVLVAFIMVFSGCTSTPEWVEQRPTDTEYYYGKGTSRSNKMSQDAVKIARTRALSDLASQLSPSTKEKIEIFEADSSESVYARFVSVQTETEFEVQLPELDVVKTWESPEGRVHYLVGLKRSRWNNWQQRQKAMTALQIKSMVSSQSDVSYFVQLNILQSALQILQDSGFSGELYGELWKQEGPLFTLILNKYRQVLAEIEVAPEDIQPVLYSKKLTISGALKAPQGSIGPFYLHLKNEDGQHIKTTAVNANGHFSFDLPSKEHPPGTHRLALQVTPFESAEPPSILNIPAISFPQTFIEVTVDEPFLDFQYESNWQNETAEEKFRVLFEDKLKVKLKTAASPYVLEVTVRFNENQNTLGSAVYTFAESQVRFMDDQAPEVVWNNGPIKGYGSTVDRAREKALKELLQRMQQQSNYFREINRLLPDISGR